MIRHDDECEGEFPPDALSSTECGCSTRIWLRKEAELVE